MIVKPSPETPLTALTLAYLGEKAGFEKGMFNVLPTTLANTPALSETLCKDDRIKKVSFTGSVSEYSSLVISSVTDMYAKTRVGKLIAKHCADGLKKLTLELGGNCPLLVFDDANLEQACDGKSPFFIYYVMHLARPDSEVNLLTSALMALKFRHAGQACITSNRIYVQKGVYNEFAEMLIQRVTALKIGHGMDKMTTMGPVTTPAGLDKIASQIEDAKKHGATVLTGGQRLDKMGGYFFEPTIIKDAGPDMLVSKEETFGPLLAIFPFETEAEAVEAANNTSVSLFHPFLPFLFLPKLFLT